MRRRTCRPSWPSSTPTTRAWCQLRPLSRPSSRPVPRKRRRARCGIRTKPRSCRVWTCTASPRARRASRGAPSSRCTCRARSRIDRTTGKGAGTCTTRPTRVVWFPSAPTRTRTRRSQWGSTHTSRTGRALTRPSLRQQRPATIGRTTAAYTGTTRWRTRRSGTTWATTTCVTHSRAARRGMRSTTRRRPTRPHRRPACALRRKRRRTEAATHRRRLLTDRTSRGARVISIDHR
mmetsp:Transcript_45316/g.124778  ORF Transcript_45316/g.124778 Transcript_45316/m.124778 type:complete len:234 (-) Transcript_45316:2793-3494(-)